MSNLIPPMISNSPPPLDLQVDDNDDDDGFGDFRVAVDLGLELSDSSIGRDSPDVWKTPSTNSELSEERVEKTDDFKDDNKTNFSNTTLISPALPIESVGIADYSEPNFDLDERLAFDLPEDPPEVIEELDRIPFTPVFSSCDVELEVRTSPEGADAESATEEKNLKTSLTVGCEASTVSVTMCESENPVSDITTQVDTGNVDDDFTDFADFSSQAFPQAPQLDCSVSQSDTSELTVDNDESNMAPTGDNNDDFDDFDDFEYAAPPIDPLQSQEKDMMSKLAAIFESEPTQPSLDGDPQLAGCLHACLDDSSSVWGNLKDLETSPALSLQWSSSSASKKLLSSLSVDSRNILIGQRWNSSMPRFAANIGCIPLEPVKAPLEEAVPAPPVVASGLSADVPEDVVPAAQFDWNSSGLTNPLDFSPSSLLDLDILIQFDKISSSSNAASSVWTPFISMEKEKSSVPQQRPEMVKNSNAVDPLDPVSDFWKSSTMPSTDILLPLSASSVLPPANCVDSSQISKMSEREEWLPSVSDTEPSTLPMSTISNLLETTDEGVKEAPPALNNEALENHKKISTEACRVVGTLPDLSFLSARKLLYAANENLTRFQARARP